MVVHFTLQADRRLTAGVVDVAGLVFEEVVNFVPLPDPAMVPGGP